MLKRIFHVYWMCLLAIKVLRTDHYFTSIKILLLETDIFLLWNTLTYFLPTLGFINV